MTDSTNKKSNLNFPVSLEGSALGNFLQTFWKSLFECQTQLKQVNNCYNQNMY